MRLRSLEVYGVPASLLDVWESTLGDTLLPIQEQAVKQYGVLQGQSLVVQAPTSAGKTFIGEMAATRAALAGRKVLYLVPTRALAEDKFEHFHRQYAPLGLRVAVSTRDRRGDDRRLVTGDFDLAVAVPEKVRALWTRAAGVSPFLGLAVVDELQTLGDPSRGPCLEMLLAELRQLPDLQIIGLSACLGSSPQLAEYLGAGWLESTQRPLELRQGVLLGESFVYRRPDGSLGEEQFTGLGSGSAEDLAEALAQAAAWLASQGEPTLCFVRDRGAALRLAEELAERLGPCGLPREPLWDHLAPTAVRGRLARLMACGVACHSADLQFEDRQVVERAFRAGQVRVLVATPTLALGVNLPVRNVLLDPFGWQSASPGGRSVIAPLSRAEYENRIGRAGRLGCSDFGRGILLADSELARSALLERYLQTPATAPRPALAGLPPLDLALHLCASASVLRQSDLQRAYRQTLTAFCAPTPDLPGEVAQAAQQCLEHGLLRRVEGSGRLVTTGLGKVAAASGVAFETFALWCSLVRELRCPPSDLEATLLACLSAEALEAPSPPGRGGDGEAVTAFQQEAQECQQDGPWLEELLHSPRHDRRRREQAARQALALRLWAAGQATWELEETLRLPAARLESLGETAGWLVETLAELGAELGWSTGEVTRLRTLAECLASGLPREALTLGRLQWVGLGRDHLLSLTREGLDSPAALREVGADRLRELLPPPAVEALLAYLHPRSQPPIKPPPTTPKAPSPASTPTPSPSPEMALEPLLRLDLDRPDRVLLGGCVVPLRPAEFRLLAALAERPGKCIAYDVLYERMWTGDRFVEPGQLYSHRSRLKAKMREAAPEAVTEQLLVTVPRHGLMLDLPPEQVVLTGGEG
jgi:helicase